jgi:HlyD family secretion protein
MMDRKIEKKKWPLKRVISYSIGGLLVIIIIINLLFRDSSAKLNVKLDRITISSVSSGPFQEFIPVIGNVIPVRTIYLDAIEGGQVEEIFIKAGNLVEEKESILQFSNTNLVLDIMYREAQFFEQRNNLRNTRLLMEQNRLSLQKELIELDYRIQTLKRQNDRYEEMLQNNHVSKQEYEQINDEYIYVIKQKALAIESYKQDSIFRKIQIEQLEGSLIRLQKNLDVVKKKQENLVLRAPIAGHLTSLNAEIGESITAGQRLGQIDILDGFKIRAVIDEHYIARIQLNQVGEFTLASKKYQLVTEKIYPEVIQGQFQVDLKFDGDEPEGIRRGQTVQIKLELGDPEEALLIPRGSFYQVTGGQWIYVIDISEKFAEKRKILLGRQNPKVFEVLDGLEEGEKVITSSYENYVNIDKLLLK